MISWYPLSGSVRLEEVREITRTKFYLNDYTFNIGRLRSDVDHGFDFNVKGIRLLPYKNNFWNSITFEMNLSRY